MYRNDRAITGHSMVAAAAVGALGQQETKAAYGNDAQQIKPQTRLEAAQSDVALAIESLRQRVGMLAHRMSNVLLPPSPCGETAEQNGSMRIEPSAAVQATEHHAWAVRQIEATVDDILNRLEA